MLVMVQVQASDESSTIEGFSALAHTMAVRIIIEVCMPMNGSVMMEPVKETLVVLPLTHKIMSLECSQEAHKDVYIQNIRV